MRTLIRHSYCTALTALGICASALEQTAQQTPLRILHRTPADTGTAGTMITVTFNRPVAGMLGSSIDPRRVMTIAPALPGLTEWRDPSTLRFVPRDPFTPGTSYSVAIDTAAIASQGKRKSEPYRFSARFPGATPLAFDGGQPAWSSGLPELGPLPLLRVLYSAPVNVDSVELLSRLELSSPARCTGTVRLRVVRQRPLGKNENYNFANAGGFDRDTVADRFRRVVEMVPRDSLPPECSGRWHIAAFDPARPADSWSYPFHTAPVARVARVEPCIASDDNRSDVCDPDGIQIVFSTEMNTDKLAELIKVSPPLPPPEIIPSWRNQVQFRTRLVPRTNYTVTIDSAVRDKHGRRVTGPLQFTVRSRDRAPGVKQQNGLAIVPRDPAGVPVVSVRVVNVDTIVMLVRPIPDSLMAPLLATDDYMRLTLLSRLEPALKDSIRVTIPVNASFNAETTLVVRLPAQTFAPGAPSFNSIRFEIGSRKIAPDTAAARAARIAAAEAANDSARRAAIAARQRGAPGAAGNPPAIQTLPTMRTVSFASPTTLDLGLIAQISDIAAHSKIAGDRGAVFLTDRSGTPLVDASITLYGSSQLPLARGISGSDGLALIAPPGRSVPQVDATVKRDPSLERLRYLEITKGDDRLILPVVAGLLLPAQSISPSANGAMYGYMRGPLRGAVTTDRDIYRPGEVLRAKAYVRYGLFADVSTLTGDSVRISLIGTDTLHMPKRVLGEFGSVVDSIVIPATTRLGYYSVQAQVLTSGVWQPVMSAYVRITEFRAPEFLLNVKLDSIPRFLGDTVPARLDAEFLFGAPMSGAVVNWSAMFRHAESYELNIPGTSGYEVGDQPWWGERVERPAVQQIISLDSLNVAGHLTIQVPTPAAHFTSSASVQLSAAITDATNQVVVQTKTILVHSAGYYVAAKVRGRPWYWRIGAPHTIDAIVVRPTGERVAGVPLRVTVVRRRWLTNDVSGAISGTYRFGADTVERFTAISSKDSVPIQVTPRNDGAYDVRIEVVDEQGRTSTTNLGGWASNYPWSTAPGGSRIALRVSADRDSTKPYSLGDTATVSFESPFDSADAWITLEREAVLEQRLLRVRAGRSTIRVPITTQHAPNIWVGITLLRRAEGGLSGTDSLPNELRVGYGELSVDSTAHRLNVRVIPLLPTQKPGDSASVRVIVNEINAGQREHPVRAEVALWAVDEGVLSLTGYQTPDLMRYLSMRNGVASPVRSTRAMLPWLSASGEVRPGVNVRRFRDALSGARAPFSIGTAGSNGLTQLSSKLEVMPADAIGVEAAPATTIALRHDFRFVAFYVGSAITDSSGSVTIRARLPDNITTFRLMATALTTGHRYGSGDARLLVTSNVVLRPALPRFVRHGDELRAAAVLNLRERERANVNVTMSATNADVRGGTRQQVSITSLEGAKPAFSMKLPATGQAESTRIRFVAQDQLLGDGDAIETVLPIRPTGAPRSHTAIGVVRGSSSATLMLPSDIDLDRSTVTVALGSSPIVAMRTQYEKLRAYSYYCTEPIITAARSLLALSITEKMLGTDSLVTGDSAAVMADVQRAVNELQRRQTGDGYFAYFPGSHHIIAPWLTAYAGTFLLEAERAGARVPKSMISAAVRVLVRDLHAESFGGHDILSGAPWERRASSRAVYSERLVALRFIRDAGSPDWETENEMARISSDLAWEDRVLLADLLWSRSDSAAAREQARTTLSDAWRVLTTAGKRIDIPDSLRGFSPFISHIRPVARLMSATMKIDPQHPLLGALAETLIQQGAAEGNRTWNTQDYGSALQALSSYVITQRSASGLRLVVRTESGRAVMMQSGDSVRRGDGTSNMPLRGLTRPGEKGSVQLALRLTAERDDGRPLGADSITAPLYYAVTVKEVPRKPPVMPNISGIVVERWYERFDSGKPVSEVTEGDLVRVWIRITVPSDRQFVAVEDLLPAGLEAVDLSLRTSGSLGPFARSNTPQHPAFGRYGRPGPVWQGVLYGSWDGGWWSPWEYKEMRDDRVVFFTRQLWAGTYQSSYVARATTAGRFIRPPAQAVEMYNAAVQGRSDGGVFVVKSRIPIPPPMKRSKTP